MTEFTEKKPGDPTFQLSGIFCFYSKNRAARKVLDQNNKETLVNEYDTTVRKIGEGDVTVNYYGTLLSDGTPGGVAGDTLVRPDDPGSYVLVGKVLPAGGGPTVLASVDLAKEVALQSGDESLINEQLRQIDEQLRQIKEQRRKIAKEQRRRENAPTREHLEQEKNRRRNFDRKSSAKTKQHHNKFISKPK